MRRTLLLACCVLLLVQPAARAQRDTVSSGTRVAFTLRYEVTAKPGTLRATLTTLIPQTLPGKQKILSIKYSQPPDEEFDKDGNRYARFSLRRPAWTTAITIDVEAEIYRRDFASAAAKDTPPPAEETDGTPWLLHEMYLEKDAPEIRRAAEGLAGKDDVETVRNVLRFVTKTLRRAPFDEKDHGALWALQQKRGDCTEFADLFVALCRANGVPARWWQGYLTTPTPAGDTPKHDRAEVFLKKHGWVPVDPFHVFLGSATFENLRPTFVYFDMHRRNGVLNNYHYYSYSYSGGGISVTNSYTVRRREAINQHETLAGPRVVP
jgi:transglutaminase-like putative cysteine protease